MGAGLIIPPGADKRIHIFDMRAWPYSIGTDYWGFFGGPATSGYSLNTDTGNSPGAGSGGDFLSAADPGQPPFVALQDAGDILETYPIFGSYSQALAFRAIMGYLPTVLNLEVYASFATASNNETATAFGWIEDGGAAGTAADHEAAIFSNGTAFGLRNGAGTTDTGAAVDTAWHLWKIRTTGSTHEWFIDDTSQGSIAIQGDEYPVSFGAGVLASTGANDIQLAWLHAWYE